MRYRPTLGIGRYKSETQVVIGRHRYLNPKRDPLYLVKLSGHQRGGSLDQLGLIG